MWNVVGQALLGAIAGQTGEIVTKAVDGLLNEAETSNYTSKVTEEVIAILFKVPGMSQAHSRDLKRATPIFSLRDGTLVKFYQNLFCDHLFLVDSEGKLIYGGFISRIQADSLSKAISQIR